MRNIILFAGLLFFTSAFFAQNALSNSLQKKKKTVQQDSVKVGVDYLKYLLDGEEGWSPQNQEIEKTLRGLVHFVEDDKIDTILFNINEYRKFNFSDYFSRPVDKVSDSLNVEGYISNDDLKEQLLRLDREVRSNVVKEEIPVPEHLFENLNEKVRLLEKDEAHLLVRDSLVFLPDSLLSFETIPDKSMISPEDFKRFQRLDSLKQDILEKARLQYNDNMLQYYIDSVSDAYRSTYINRLSGQEQEKLRNEIKESNHNRLAEYNESVRQEVNLNLNKYLKALTDFAEKDSTDLWIFNSDEDSTQMWLRKYYRNYQRFYIKNEQNDSLGIRIQNLDKNALKILIDDGVTFSRFTEKQKRDFELQEFLPETGLQKVDKMYNIYTPWVLGGDGAVGFTQTYLSNWKKGGKSALSTLLVLKGFANYSQKKVKWENDIEIRNGWLKPGDDKIQKNDDKFEFTSRFGISAFKKWYYSAELDFETQFFYGYKYPNREQPISGFLAPSRTLLKFGLDYKPNKKFSLFLSPFTSKTVYVRDTAKIDASKFGIEAGKKRYWEPGLHTDVKFKKDITPDMTYEMKYQMFINYRSPFTKFDINWENNFVMRLTDFINMRVMLHFIYDDNVKFPVYETIDGTRVEVGKEPKWQMKEFITVGFSYKLNKRIHRRERVN